MTTSCSFFLQTGMSLSFVVPRGMEEIVNYTKKRYHNKPMFVTENGTSILIHRLSFVSYAYSYPTRLSKSS